MPRSELAVNSIPLPFPIMIPDDTGEAPTIGFHLVPWISVRHPTRKRFGNGIGIGIGPCKGRERIRWPAYSASPSSRSLGPPLLSWGLGPLPWKISAV